MHKTAVSSVAILVLCC